MFSTGGAATAVTADSMRQSRCNDDRLVKRLIQTNWIRTVALLLESFVVFASLLGFKG